MTGYDSCAVKHLAEKARSPQPSFLSLEQGHSNPTVSPEVYQTKRAIHE